MTTIGTSAAALLLLCGTGANAAHECLLRIDGVASDRGGTITQVARGGVCRFDVGVCGDAWSGECVPDPGDPLTITAAPPPSAGAPAVASREHPCVSLGFYLVPAKPKRTVRRRIRVTADEAVGLFDRDRLVLRCRPEPTVAPPVPTCMPTGCSQTRCESAPMVDACIWNPSDACYRTATCALQPDGACGWTPSQELADCLADPAGPHAAVAVLIERARHEIDVAALTPPDDALDTWADIVDALHATLTDLGVPWRDTWRVQALHDVFPSDLDVDRARRGFVRSLTRLIDDLGAAG